MLYENKVKLSVVVITLNEEDNIEECLQSVAFADERIVLDGESTDQTIKKAEALGATIHRSPFNNFAEQKNKALQLARNNWILMLDADERVTEELALEIKSVLEKDPGEHVYGIYRKTRFFGSLLKFSGTQNDAPIRLVPKGKACMVQPVHEYVETNLPTRFLTKKLLHNSTKDRKQYNDKLDRYIAFEQDVMKEKGFRPAWHKKNIFPILKFLQLYFLKLGILDGKAGFQFAYLAAHYLYTKHKRFESEFLKNA